MGFLRDLLKLCHRAPRSWPSRWLPQTICLVSLTLLESWCGCVSAAWATVTLTHPSSWVSSCGRFTMASPISGTRARTKCPRSCIRCVKASVRWRMPATPCGSEARRSPNTCWLTCSPFAPRLSTLRKEWFKSCTASTFCFLWCHFMCPAECVLYEVQQSQAVFTLTQQIL